MSDESPFPAIHLNTLAEAMKVAEEAHRQNIPIRSTADSTVPVNCSCGLVYSAGSAWSECKAHQREVLALAMLAALHRTCETCLGSGLWHKFRATFECPDCDGRGRTLTPLPPMHFQDASGAAWVVDGPDISDQPDRWVHVHQVG